MTINAAAIVDAIDEQDWVDPASTTVAGAVKSSFEFAGPLAIPIQNVLHGVWQGHPVHPDLTDIPLGAWTVAAVLDTAEHFGVESAGQGADAAIAIGLIGALGAAVTGLTDWHVLEEGSKPKKVGLVHAALNIAATVLYGSSLILRRRNQRLPGRLLAAAGYGLVGAAAYLGGILVFDQKIGVDHAPREGFPRDWTATVKESDLLIDQPALTKVGEIDVVVIKSKDGVAALANSCSHLGGPLCEGKLVEGGIVCPWHYSRFDVETGAVLDGPATAPQPVFETRVNDETVEIRAAAT
jgi:nitrite reductase/ring-hydroxylating ferredoxin subunit/uncharacterized membrane protein